MVRYKCVCCEKEFIGDYGLGPFPLCSTECDRTWHEGIEKGLEAYVEYMGIREKERFGEKGKQ